MAAESPAELHDVSVPLFEFADGPRAASSGRPASRRFSSSRARCACGQRQRVVFIACFNVLFMLFAVIIDRCHCCRRVVFIYFLNSSLLAVLSSSLLLFCGRAYRTLFGTCLVLLCRERQRRGSRSGSPTAPHCEGGFGGRLDNWRLALGAVDAMWRDAR